MIAEKRVGLDTRWKVYRFVRIRIVRKDCHYQLFSSMSADPLASPDGSQHGDLPQHGALPGFTGYTPFIQQPQQDASMPGNTNGNDANTVPGFNLPGNYTSASPTQATFRDATDSVGCNAHCGNWFVRYQGTGGPMLSSVDVG